MAGRIGQHQLRQHQSGLRQSGVERLFIIGNERPGRRLRQFERHMRADQQACFFAAFLRRARQPMQGRRYAFRYAMAKQIHASQRQLTNNVARTRPLDQS